MMIDLGKKSGEGCCSEPLGPSDKNGVYYPTLYLDSKDEKLCELPDSGTMTIQFEKVRWEESKSKDGERYSCTIEVQKIVSVDSGEVNPPATKRDNEATTSALDALAKALSEKKASEDEEE